MKKLTSLVALILALTMVFCACNTAPAETTPENTTVPTTASTTPEETTTAETTTEATTTEATTEETTTEETTTAAPEPEVPELEKKSIKVLAIGNSFSEDATAFLWDVCESAGMEDIIIANLYIGGCSLDKHWSNMQANAADYDYQFNEWGKITKSKKSIRYALEHQEWDIITIQQVSQDSGRTETFKNLQNILDYIKKYSKNPDAKIYWHMTWAYQQNSNHSGFANYGRDQMTMYNAILNAGQYVLDNYEEIDGVIPSGTAVQNLRTSYIGDKITRDGYHMSWSTGRYLTALTWFHTFTGYPVEYVEWYPTHTYAGISYAVNPEDLDAIRESVTNAVADPFKVTPSAFPGEETPEDPNKPKTALVTSGDQKKADFEVLAKLGIISSASDASKYTVLDWKPQVASYYNSGSNSTRVSSANSTASNIPNFTSSLIFEKDALPVGTIIIVDEGYQYRPEGWKNLNTKTSPRPDNVSENVVVVDEAWCGNYTHRAFNLSAIATKKMTAADSAHLRIYVPKA